MLLVRVASNAAGKTVAGMTSCVKLVMEKTPATMHRDLLIFDVCMLFYFATHRHLTTTVTNALCD